MVTSEKFCPGCKTVKSTVDFQKNKIAKDGLQYHCKSCRKLHDSRPEKRKQDRERYHNNKDNYLNSYYKRIYGITLNQYKDLLHKQNNVCAICGDTCISGKHLAVELIVTGKVRGLLCTKCNQGLGQFNDNINLLKQAILYLERKYGV